MDVLVAIVRHEGHRQEASLPLYYIQGHERHAKSFVQGKKRAGLNAVSFFVVFLFTLLTNDDNMYL